MAAGFLRGLVALAGRLPVGVLLSVLQAELVTNLEGLADSPHDAHGVGLRGGCRGWGWRGGVVNGKSEALLTLT